MKQENLMRHLKLIKELYLTGNDKLWNDFAFKTLNLNFNGHSKTENGNNYY